MNFDAFSGNRRTRRQPSSDYTPAMVESLETRALLTPGPSILSPASTITVSQPTVTWDSVANAVRYDLWISDVEARERIVFKEGIVGTTTTLTTAEKLNLGVNRIWVRATVKNPQTGALSQTDWGTPKDVLLLTRPTVTGPVNPADPTSPPKIDGSDWAITWTSPAGARSFEVFVSNQTTSTSTTYTVQNGTAATDADGDVNENFIRNPGIDLTSADHGLITGQEIRITGVVGIEAANGDFAVTVISEDVFRLTSVIGNGSYTAGGKWVKLNSGVPAASSTSKSITNAVITNSGHQIESEIRSFYLNGAVPVIGSAAQTVSNVINRSYVDVTSENHGLATGTRVRISGVSGNTAANGDFTVTAISEHVFRLNGAAGNGTYTSGGTWIRLNNSVPAAGATSRSLTKVTNTRAIDLIVLNHGLKTGDKVRISGVQGNTAANGVFIVTVISPNAIQLRGVTGQAVFTQGGQLVKLTEFKSNLEIGKYRIFVRYRDDGGRVSAWSNAYDFEVAPAVNVQRPQGPTFDDQQPLLQWDAVPGATHYQIEVFRTGESTPLYKADYLTETSFKFPDKLTPGQLQSFQFRVRARKLHEVAVISLKGNPATGSFRISLTTTSKTPVTVQTALLSYDSTANQVRAAINALDGFENVDVTSEGVAPNLTYRIQIPLEGNGASIGGLGGSPVKVVVVGSVSPGTIASTTSVSPRVDGLWSPFVTFSTRVKPVITGPIGIDNADPTLPPTVTDLRPTITWTSIDKAARYEIWVERSASTSTYLRTTASTNSFRFATGIQSGNYTVKVRAVSTTGVFTEWSNEYAFTATAGAAVIRSVTVSSGRQATIQWAGVAEAATYEVQIAWIGVNFDYLHPTGLITTSYTTTTALSPGNYRAWVRAVLADGTKLTWSTFVNFAVVEAQQPNSDIMADEELIALKSAIPDRSERAEIPESAENTDAVVVVESEAASSKNPAISTVRALLVPDTSPESGLGEAEDTELIQRLAEACASQEWWISEEVS